MFYSEYMAATPERSRSPLAPRALSNLFYLLPETPRLLAISRGASGSLGDWGRSKTCTRAMVEPPSPNSCHLKLATRCMPLL